MNNEELLDKLSEYKDEISKATEAEEIIRLAVYDLFGFIHDNPTLKNIFRERIYYEAELQADKSILHLQKILIQVIAAALKTLDTEAIAKVKDKFDCSVFRTHQKALSVSAQEAVHILSQRKNFWLLGEESIEHTGKQYDLFEKVIAAIRQYSREDSTFDTLMFSYKTTIDSYVHKVKSYYNKEHIDDYLAMLVWVMDKDSHPEYLFSPGPKNKNVLLLKPDVIKPILLSVVDNLAYSVQRLKKPRTILDEVADMQAMKPNYFSYLNVELNIAERFVIFNGHRIDGINPDANSIKLLKLLLSNKEAVTDYNQVAMILGVKFNYNQTEKDFRPQYKDTRKQLVNLLGDHDRTRKQLASDMIKSVRNHGYAIVPKP